jgi:hypothetical protein
MAGHIELGKFADTTLRPYVLVDPKNWQSATANPYVARVSTGGQYSDLDTFNDWAMEDWHTGVGNGDPEVGPLFSVAETRFPGYLMLPPGWEYPLNVHNQSQTGTNWASNFELLSSKMYSVSFVATKTASIDGVWVYVHCPYDKSTTVELRQDNAGAPGTVLKSATVSSIQDRVHAHWQKYTFPGPQALTASTRYHIAIKTTVAATLGNGVAPYLPGVTMSGSERCYSSTDGGTTWALEGTGLGGFYYLLSYSANNTSIMKGVYVHDSKVFMWIDDAVYLLENGDLTEVSTDSITDVLQIDNLLYMAAGIRYKVFNMDTNTGNDTEQTETYRFLLHGGYLWRSRGNGISYTADEVTWTDLPDMANVPATNGINGLAGLDGTVYAATRDGLYMAAAGDKIVQVAMWPEVSADNGIGMVAWEGALYIPLVGGTIMRYSPDGAMLNVGINAKEELPADVQGTVTHLRPTNYFLMAVVEARGSNGYSSLWAYNVDGWHCLGLGPQGVGGGAICIDRTNQYLYWGLDRALLLRTDMPSMVNNPANNPTEMKFAREGWVEYDRFYGGHRTLDKDFDRVYIDTKRVGQNVQVFWQDNDNYADYYVNHNGEMGWQYLGAPTYGASAIQFPATARPGGKSFRLALRLTDQDVYNTGAPVVRGVSVKYSTNVADRWRWVLPILVSDNQQLPDGTISEYTAADMMAHLDALVEETGPLQFVDLTGTAYTVKVTGASRNCVRYDWLEGHDEPDAQYVYTLTLEEMS